MLRTFRLRKEVAAYVCNILESQEGITTFSTIPPQAGDPHRDLKLLIPIGFVAEVEALMNQLKSELNLETGDAIYELENES